MGDLEVATRVTRVGPTSFTAELSPEWEIWGPNGGYLASVALRAAGVQMERTRPVSINVHFVGGAASRTVDIEVVINRASRVATSATVTISQDGRLAVVATVWGADADLPGLVHQTFRTPVAGVEQPEGLPSVRELMAHQGPAPHPFWYNVDQRPLGWIVDWDNRPAREPESQAWFRFVPTSTFDDPWVDACRSAILLDLDAWSAACAAHTGTLEHFAPTIELNARFVGDTRADEWLFSAATAPVAAGGTIAATGEVWTRDGRLVAIGGSTLLCRPAARRPDL